MSHYLEELPIILAKAGVPVAKIMPVADVHSDVHTKQLELATSVHQKVKKDVNVHAGEICQKHGGYKITCGCK